MAPARMESEAVVLGAFPVEKVEAAQEDSLLRWRESAGRGLARHSAMLLLPCESFEVLTGRHLAELDTHANARILYCYERKERLLL